MGNYQPPGPVSTTISQITTHTFYLPAVRDQQPTSRTGRSMMYLFYVRTSYKPEMVPSCTHKLKAPSHHPAGPGGGATGMAIGKKPDQEFSICKADPNTRNGHPTCDPAGLLTLQSVVHNTLKGLPMALCGASYQLQALSSPARRRQRRLFVCSLFPFPPTEYLRRETPNEQVRGCKKEYLLPRLLRHAECSMAGVRCCFFCFFRAKLSFWVVTIRPLRFNSALHRVTTTTKYVHTHMQSMVCLTVPRAPPRLMSLALQMSSLQRVAHKDAIMYFLMAMLE